MELSAALARVVLGLAFGLAAVLKLRHPQDAVEGARSLGVPTGLATAVGRTLPVGEIGVVALLVFLPAAGALAAAALLLAFTVAIANQLLHGRAPVCHCFGSLSARPAGPAELARNGALLALCIVVLVAGR